MSIKMAKHSFIKSIITIVLMGTLTILQGQTLLTASLNSPGGAGILSESCGGPYELVISRGSDNPDTTFIFISDFGDALIGVDYNFPPGSFPITMLPGDSVVIIPINVVNDGLIEGLETLFWEITFIAGTESGTINFETAIVDEYKVEILSTTDTIEWCRDIPYVLQASSEAEIHWSPSSVFDDSTGTVATVRPQDSGWYFASVGNDTCGAKDSIYFNLAIVEIAGPDTIFICLDGPGVVLHGTLEGLATDFTWIPGDSTLSNPNILNPVANPTVTTTYLLQSDIGVCTASDRIVVRVDSIPGDQHIDIAPLKPYYCAGEIVALFSPSFDTLDFPDLTFNWIPYNSTFTSAQTLLNAALILQDTTTYFRENLNNACRSIDSILINVVPSSVPLSVNDTTLCPGEKFRVFVLSDQVTDPEWTPEEGLSCTKCLSPTVTVTGFPGSTVSYQFSGMILECPVGATLTIHIPPIQLINISGDQVVCSGDMVPLTITNPEGLSGFHWTIDVGNASLSCDNCPNPIVTINSNDVLTLFVSADTDNEQFCGAQGSITLSPGQQLQVSGPEIETCLGGTAVASTGNAEYTDVQWDVTEGQLSLSCSNCDNPVVTVNSIGVLHFFAESSDPDVCRILGSVSVSIYERDGSKILILPDSTNIGQGAEVMAELDFSPSPASVMWTVNGVSIPSTATSIEFNASEEINFVEAKFINSKGCEQIDTISFPTVPPEYKIPNAFTPDNGDEINDNFKIIINGNIVIDEFLIFNRWGQLVYKAEDDLQGWDGRFKGEPAASDTYVYSAKLRFPDGRTKIAKGDVILLR